MWRLKNNLKNEDFCVNYTEKAGTCLTQKNINKHKYNRDYYEKRKTA